MTPAAKVLIAEVVQTIKTRWISPRFAMLMRAQTIGAEVGMPRVVYQRDLMFLGSVLLPATNRHLSLPRTSPTRLPRRSTSTTPSSACSFVASYRINRSASLSARPTSPRGMGMIVTDGAHREDRLPWCDGSMSPTKPETSGGRTGARYRGRSEQDADDSTVARRCYGVARLRGRDRPNALHGARAMTRHERRVALIRTSTGEWIGTYPVTWTVRRLTEYVAAERLNPGDIFELACGDQVVPPDDLMVDHYEPGRAFDLISMGAAV